MTRTERRDEILRVIYTRRRESIANLAVEFGVSVRTIKYDIEALMCLHPIETVRGRYGGCVKVLDWFFLTKTRLCAEQIALLKCIAEGSSTDDLIVLNSILSQFAS